MAFGQAAGPPATQKQLDQLLALLAEQGFDSFREARHPIGLNQRQSNGRFTVGEADELIERLETGAQSTDPNADLLGQIESRVVSTSGSETRLPASFVDRVSDSKRRNEIHAVRGLSDETLADELVRRGWCCIPPG